MSVVGHYFRDYFRLNEPIKESSILSVWLIADKLSSEVPIFSTILTHYNYWQNAIKWNLLKAARFPLTTFSYLSRIRTHSLLSGFWWASERHHRQTIHFHHHGHWFGHHHLCRKHQRPNPGWFRSQRLDFDEIVWLEFRSNVE